MIDWKRFGFLLVMVAVLTVTVCAVLVLAGCGEERSKTPTCKPPMIETSRGCRAPS